MIEQVSQPDETEIKKMTSASAIQGPCKHTRLLLKQQPYEVNETVAPSKWRRQQSRLKLNNYAGDMPGDEYHSMGKLAGANGNEWSMNDRGC